MPISPKPFVLQLFDEVILPKLAHQYFKDGEEFYNKLRYSNAPILSTCLRLKSDISLQEELQQSPEGNAQQAIWEEEWLQVVLQDEEVLHQREGAPQVFQAFCSGGGHEQEWREWRRGQLFGFHR